MVLTIWIAAGTSLLIAAALRNRRTASVAEVAEVTVPKLVTA